MLDIEEKYKKQNSINKKKTHENHNQSKNRKELNNIICKPYNDITFSNNDLNKSDDTIRSNYCVLRDTYSLNSSRLQRSTSEIFYTDSMEADKSAISSHYNDTIVLLDKYSPRGDNFHSSKSSPDLLKYNLSDCNEEIPENQESLYCFYNLEISYGKSCDDHAIRNTESCKYALNCISHKQCGLTGSCQCSIDKLIDKPITKARNKPKKKKKIGDLLNEHIIDVSINDQFFIPIVDENSPNKNTLLEQTRTLPLNRSDVHSRLPERNTVNNTLNASHMSAHHASNLIQLNDSQLKSLQYDTVNDFIKPTSSIILNKEFSSLCSKISDGVSYNWNSSSQYNSKQNDVSLLNNSPFNTLQYHCKKNFVDNTTPRNHLSKFINTNPFHIANATPSTQTPSLCSPNEYTPRQFNDSTPNQDIHHISDELYHRNQFGNCYNHFSNSDKNNPSPLKNEIPLVVNRHDKKKERSWIPENSFHIADIENHTATDDNSNDKNSLFIKKYFLQNLLRNHYKCDKHICDTTMTKNISPLYLSSNIQSNEVLPMNSSSNNIKIEDITNENNLLIFIVLSLPFIAMSCGFIFLFMSLYSYFLPDKSQCLLFLLWGLCFIILSTLTVVIIRAKYNNYFLYFKRGCHFKICFWETHSNALSSKHIDDNISQNTIKKNTLNNSYLNQSQISYNYSGADNKNKTFVSKMIQPLKAIMYKSRPPNLLIKANAKTPTIKIIV